MRCEDTAAQLADYLAGSLGEAERTALESHIATCPACREESDAATRTWQMLGEIPAAQLDSRAMRARFEAMLAGSASALSTRSATPGTLGRIGEWIRRHTRMQPLLQGCAALLVLLVGIQVGRGIKPPPPVSSPEVRQLSQEVRDLRQMVTLSLMQQQSASERLKGVSWSNQLDRPGDEVVTALIDTLMHDANVNVRLASIDALKRFAERGEVRRAAVHALDTQKSALVQMALIDFVVETQDHEALGALRKLSHDTTVDDSVRARAAWGIDHLGAA
jgi:anti-sigma factor RsiW